MAFQPIVDTIKGQVFAYEALVRGPHGEGAGTVLSAVKPDNLYAFDQACRVKAIEWAGRLDLAATGAFLSINILPNAVYEPRACIRTTLEVASRVGFPLDKIIFEYSEAERANTDHLKNILHAYHDIGFKTALDDFGAGHAGLSLLAGIQPDIVKLDMALIRGIDQDPVRRTIVRHSLALLDELNIQVICEGVETREEVAVLQDFGVHLMQGFWFGRPSFESLAPAEDWWKLEPNISKRELPRVGNR